MKLGHICLKSLFLLFSISSILNAQQNITVFGGTGAVGSYFTLLLHKSNNTVHGIGSGKGMHFDTIRVNGLKVNVKKRVADEFISVSEIIPPAVFKDPDNKQDFILFALKQPNLSEDVALQAIEMSKFETVFGVVANGLPFFFADDFIDSVDPGGKIQYAFYDKCVIGIMPLIAANISSPGETTINRDLNTIKVIIGEPSHRANCRPEAIENIKWLFERAGIPTTWTEKGIRNEILKKEQFALTVNTLSAISTKPIDEIFEDTEYQPFLRYGVEVVNELSRCLGIGQLRTWEEFKALQITKGHLSSLARDVADGQAGESVAIVDAFIEIVKDKGINNLAPLEKL